MIKLPDAKVIHDGKSEKARQRCEGWNACLAEVQRLNATAQPVSDGCKVPEGWKLVPLIAFPSQWAAGQKAFDSAGINKVDAVYKAMVAAAPGGQDE